MTTHVPPLCGDNLRILLAFRSRRWSVTSWQLTKCTPIMRPSARISELLHRYEINIVTTSRMVTGRKRTTFYVPVADRPHARAVLNAALAAERAKQKRKGQQ